METVQVPIYQIKEIIKALEETGKINPDYEMIDHVLNDVKNLL